MTRTELLLLTALTLNVACTTPDASAVVPLDRPTEDGYPYVAEVMERRCGTIDCHGTPVRNLIVYGDEGLRLAAADRPCVPAATTAAEVAQDYASLVGLEPEALSAVVARRGANPDDLTFIAKPLGIEGHMGGKVFAAGDDTYTCLTSWLTGETNTSACLAALPTTLCGVSARDAFDAGSD